MPPSLYEVVDTSVLSVDVIDLPHEGEMAIDGIAVQTAPAYNDSDGEHVDEDGTPFHVKGEVIGLLLTIAETTVFFPSNTDFLDHHKSMSTEVFLPPIGGHYTMDRHEAADFSRSITPELVFPVHYDTFEPIETDTKALRRN